MHPTSLLFLLSACATAHGTAKPHALWQFARMITCTQPEANPLAYSDYGCWCGLGGSGTPKDEVDRCCEVHDLCYRASRHLPECRPVIDVPYIKMYKFSCMNGQVSCSASNDICQASVCECDRVAANCFAQSTYNPENKNLDPGVHCLT
ncbi:phospholipase A2 [Esox lucius]|uniref:Phospholipase A2 n=1 Tax=Esox lucius TaxID=8010 RepID=A0AAY5KSL7_ESOLU|nr:phospholipase A2 [Esox lucius]